MLNLFALGGEKESKYNEKTPFWGSVQKPLAFERRDAYTCLSGLFPVAHFLK